MVFKIVSGPDLEVNFNLQILLAVQHFARKILLNLKYLSAFQVTVVQKRRSKRQLVTLNFLRSHT